MVLLDQHGEEVVTDELPVTPTVIIENNNIQSLAFDVQLDLRDDIPIISIKVYNRIEQKRKPNLALVTPNQRLIINENQ